MILLQRNRVARLMVMMPQSKENRKKEGRSACVCVVR